MFPLAPPTRGSSKAAARRATAVGSNSVSASTVRIRSPRANRAPALIAGLRPQRVPVADHRVYKPLCPRSFSEGARLVGRAVIDDDDFHRSQGLAMQRHDRTIEAGTSVEGREHYADAGGWRLAFCLLAVASCRKRRETGATGCSAEGRRSAPRTRAGTHLPARGAGPSPTCGHLRRVTCELSGDPESPLQITGSRLKGASRIFAYDPSTTAALPHQTAKPSLVAGSRISPNFFAANERKTAILWKS